MSNKTSYESLDSAQIIKCNAFMRNIMYARDTTLKERVKMLTCNLAKAIYKE